MPTIFRVREMRVVIFSNDHTPPHVHVLGRGVVAKIELGREGKPATVVVNEGLSRTQLAEVLARISLDEALLLQRWREIHGDA